MKPVLDVAEIIPPYGSCGTVKYVVRVNGAMLCSCDISANAYMIMRALKFYGDHLVSQNELEGK